MDTDLKVCDSENCAKYTTNERFCSKRCSAITTNAESPRRHKTVKQCLMCESSRHASSRYCMIHAKTRAEVLWPESSVRDAVLTSKTWMEVAEKLLVFVQNEMDETKFKFAYNAGRRLADLYSIDSSHLLGRAHYRGTVFVTYSDLVQRSASGTKISCGALKTALIKQGLKEKRCEQCKNDTWFDHELTLELHHVDGDHFNLTLSNLQILCPNCHSNTPNWRGRGKKKPNA